MTNKRIFGRFDASCLPFRKMASSFPSCYPVVEPRDNQLHAFNFLNVLTLDLTPEFNPKLPISIECKLHSGSPPTVGKTPTVPITNTKCFPRRGGVRGGKGFPREKVGGKVQESGNCIKAREINLGSTACDANIELSMGTETMQALEMLRWLGWEVISEEMLGRGGAFVHLIPSSPHCPPKGFSLS